MFKRKTVFLVCVCMLISAGTANAVTPMWGNTLENDGTSTIDGGAVINGPSSYVPGAYGSAFAGNSSRYIQWDNTDVENIFSSWNDSLGWTVDLYFKGNHWNTHSGDSGLWGIVKRLDGNNAFILAVVRNGSLRLYFSDVSGAQHDYLLTGTTLTNDTRYRLTMRQYDGAFEVYLDGGVYSNSSPVFTATDLPAGYTCPLPPYNDGSVEGGRDMTVGIFSSYFGGPLQSGEWVDEVRVYNGYYTPAEIGLPAGSECAAGDVDGDCIVDLKDLMIVASNWLMTGATPGQGNIDSSNSVNMYDYAILANDWLTGASISITLQPTNATEIEGETASFTVAAAGSTPMTYQWQKDTVNLSDGYKISGATTDTIVISNLYNTDQGNYRCVVSNIYSSQPSNEATLTVIDSGTTGHWTMDDNSANTTVLDSTDNNYDGTFVDATGNPDTDQHHSADKQEGTGSLEFDAVDDYVTIPRSSVLETGNATTHKFSVSAWVKGDYTSPPTNHTCIVGTGSGGWFLGSTPGNDYLIIACWLVNGASQQTAFVTDNTPVFDGQWHHVAGVFDGSSLHLYVDGNHGQVSTIGGEITNTYDSPVLIGCKANAAGHCWDGLIDDVRVYARAFSTGEDLYHYAYPNQAWNPSPECGVEPGVPTDTELSWSPGDLAISHDVYLGTDFSAVAGATNGSIEFQGNQTETTFNTTLDYNKDYYWRVDEINSPEPSSPWKGRIWSFTTKVATGRQTLIELTTSRRYILYVPTDYDPVSPYPLIISSHGTGQNGDTEMDSTGPNSGYDNGTPTWPTLAEDNDVIVACPDMTGAYGPCSPDATQLSQLASDDTAVMNIISEVQGTYNIDSEAILMTGFSGGGHTVHYIGLRHPDVFRASCARHGNFSTAEVPSPLPAGAIDMPVYIFNGSDDYVCGPSESMAWYTAQGFTYLDSEIFYTYPSNVHTTDRHHALEWFFSTMKPRIIVSTDIGGNDPDDFQSLVHYLVCADRFDTEGLIASPPYGGRVSDILATIDVYETDYSNLNSHARFPTPQSLRDVSKQGAINAAPSAGYSTATDGSNQIVTRANASDARPLWIQVWGSITDVAQAVHDDPGIKSKIRVYSIGSWNTAQDVYARNYLYNSHSDMWWIENDTTFRGMYTGGDQSGDLGNITFVATHVRYHGALGDFYYSKKTDIKMGDTPAVLYMFSGDPDDPTVNHWGGRFQTTGHGTHYWHDLTDPAYAESGYNGAKTVNVHREDYLRDWETRMDWADAP